MLKAVSLLALNYWLGCALFSFSVASIHALFALSIVGRLQKTGFFLGKTSVLHLGAHHLGFLLRTVLILLILLRPLQFVLRRIIYDGRLLLFKFSFILLITELALGGVTIC